MDRSMAEVLVLEHRAAESFRFRPQKKKRQKANKQTELNNNRNQRFFVCAQRTVCEPLVTGLLISCRTEYHAYYWIWCQEPKGKCYDVYLLNCVCVCMRENIRMCTRAYVCMCVCMWVCVCTYVIVYVSDFMCVCVWYCKDVHFTHL